MIWHQKCHLEVVDGGNYRKDVNMSNIFYMSYQKSIKDNCDTKIPNSNTPIQIHVISISQILIQRTALSPRTIENHIVTKIIDTGPLNYIFDLFIY